MLLMCEKPKRTEAVIQPTVSLFVARERKFCSRPRKRSSSGNAVKKRKEDERGDGAKSCERCSAGSEGVDQENEKDNYAEEPAGAWSDDCGNAIRKIVRGKEQHHGEK